MKKINKAIIALLFSLALSGCSKPREVEEQPQNYTAPPPPSAVEAQRAVAQERQLQSERAKSEQLEQALRQSEERHAEEEKSRSRWQTAALLLGSGCIVCLFAGAALGAGAKRDGTA